MMKRIAGLLAALWLAAAGIAAAYGEEAQPDTEAAGRAVGMMDLFDVGPDTPVWLGTALPVHDGVAIAAASVLPENPGRLVITDGGGIWEVESATPDAAGLLMTVIYIPTEDPPAYAPFTMVDPEDMGSVSGLNVATGDENLSRINRNVYSVTPLTWRSLPCLLVSMSGPAAPGSPLLTSDGTLVGIAAAEWAEGTNRMVFLTQEGALQSLTESLDLLVSLDEGNPPEGFTATADGNVLTCDWSAMALPEPAEGEQLYLVISDVMNSYLTYVILDGSFTDFSILLTPGRTYHSGITASADAPDDTPEAYASTTMPEAEKLTDYGFVSRVCAIAEAPAEGLAAGALPEPVTQVTEELLRSGRAYFYSATSYEVTKQISDITLLVSLTDPLGNNYRYVSGWIYDPSYMDNDAWAVSLDEAGLLEMLNASGYPAGTYQVDFYIGGKLADSFTFRLP